MAFNAYVPAQVDPSVPEQRIVEALPLLPEGGVVTGWAALRLWGVAYADGWRAGQRLPVPLTGATTGRRRCPQVTVCYEAVPADERAVAHGVPVSIPTRALLDELRRTDDLRERVVLVDMCVAAGVVDLGELRALASTCTRRRARLAVEAVALAREGSRSPGETRLRLIWSLDAGLPDPLLNQDVLDGDGRFICCADLLDEEAGLVVEYDGAEHLTMTRRARDRTREEGCRDVGLEYTSVMGPDLRSPGLVVRRLLAARERAEFAPSEQRTWRLA